MKSGCTARERSTVTWNHFVDFFCEEACGGGSKGRGLEGGVGAGEVPVVPVGVGKVRFRSCEGRRISSMPSFCGVCWMGVSSSSSSAAWIWASASVSLVMSFSRAKRRGEASRALWAAASSR